MRIFDAHCDVLSKLAEDDSLDFYSKDDRLQVNYPQMIRGHIAIQAFALFVSPQVPSQHRFDYALQMIDQYYEKVLRNNRLIPIVRSADIDFIYSQNSNLRGGLLTLEGADALQGNIVYLRILYRLGVRALGFTWNYRNEAGDGVEEPNPGGLSFFGRQVLSEANRLGILLDVAHLSEKGFWDVIELSNKPIMASHANCRSIHDHKRNLNDDQLRAIFRKGGVVGLTFVPQFIKDAKQVVIDDLLHHLDHVLSLGGEDHLAFGSDFDGITQTMADMKNMGDYAVLKNVLLRHYKEGQVKKWFAGNWCRLFKLVLP